MESILQNWGLAGMVITPIASVHKSAWDIGGAYVLKRYSNIGELKRSVQLSELLGAENIPVAHYIPTTDGQITPSDSLYCLMTKVSGTHVDFYEQPALANEMGRELARLHGALARIESKIPCTDEDFLASWKQAILPDIRNEMPDAFIESLDERFSRFYPRLPRQLIHRDVHRFNVLFDDGRLTAWLDFDLGQRNTRVFDIAYLLSGLLFGNTDDPVKVGIWRSLSSEIVKGYAQTSALTADECKALPVMMIMIELLFAYFWGVQQNPEQRNAALDFAKWLCDDYYQLK